MLTRITTLHTALPTPTAASVTGPWRPASTVSTMFMPMDEAWLSTSGSASTKLTRISRSRRAARLSVRLMGASGQAAARYISGSPAGARDEP